MREVYGRAGVDPADIGYFEAHGTGTQAGDTTEMGSLQRVLGEIIRLEYRAGRYRSVLRKTRYARDRYGEVAADVINEWERRLEAVSTQRLATAKSAFQRGDAIAALAK